MPEGSDNNNNFETEIEQIFAKDDLDQAGVEFAGVLKTHAGKEIERIFNESNSLEESQTKIVDLVRSYAEKALSKVTDEGVRKRLEEAREQLIEKKVEGIGARIAKYAKEKEPAKEQGANSQESKLDSITPESKKNFQTLLKNFVIYEIYQEMNPRRIAGETEQMNYAANFERRGEEKAEKYVKESKVSKQEREQIRRKVRKKMRARGRMSLRRESSAELDLMGNSKSRTVDALDLAGRLRGRLEERSSGVVLSKSEARELQHRKQAEEHKNPKKEQGQGMGGR